MERRAGYQRCHLPALLREAVDRKAGIQGADGPFGEEHGEGKTGSEYHVHLQYALPRHRKNGRRHVQPVHGGRNGKGSKRAFLQRSGTDHLRILPAEEGHEEGKWNEVKDG